MAMDLQKLKTAAPSLITACSIFCGFYAVTICADDPAPADLSRAAYLIIVAFVFDVLDGRVARLLRVQSVFGVELDSLADVASFGVAPALLVYKWAMAPLGWPGKVVAFLFALCGALRLARFNAMAHSPDGGGGASRYFLGLPIPLAAGTIVSFVICQVALQNADLDSSLRIAVAGGVLVLAVLMVSNVRYRTFKDTRFNAVSLAIGGVVVSGLVGVGFLLGPAYVLPASFTIYLVCGTAYPA